MSKTIGCVVLLVGALVVCGLFLMGQYNGLVKSEESVKTAWSQVENAYQRRMDLIPNLVETVKGAANFEKETYIAVAEARANAGKIQITPELLEDPEMFKKFEQAQASLASALSRLIAVAEAYPELKANQNFLNLQNQLEGTENRIAVERRRFNESVQQYNTKVRTFPASLVAGIFGFKQRPYFSAAPEAQTPPKVQF